MAKRKNFVGFLKKTGKELSVGLKKTGKGISVGLKKTGKFVEHEKVAFGKWKAERQEAQAKRHVLHLKEARKHFKEEFVELGRQRALMQVKSELDVQHLEHERAIQTAKTERLQMGFQRDQIRHQISEISPSPARQVGRFAKEIFVPSTKELELEKEGSVRRKEALNGSRRGIFSAPKIAGYKTDKEILAEIDRKAGIR